MESSDCLWTGSHKGPSVLGNILYTEFGDELKSISVYRPVRETLAATLRPANWIKESIYFAFCIANRYPALRRGRTRNCKAKELERKSKKVLQKIVPYKIVICHIYPRLSIIVSEGH